MSSEDLDRDRESVVPISREVLNQLEKCSNASVFNSDLFEQTLNIARDVLCSGSNTNVELNANEEQKSLCRSLLTVLVESSKHDLDEQSFAVLFEDAKWSKSQIQTVVKFYKENKASMREVLGKIGRPLPHIVDLNWRLDCAIKSSNVGRLNEPVYTVDFVTQTTGKDEPELVQVSCRLEHMQDLVGKLREACKSVEKHTQL